MEIYNKGEITSEQLMGLNHYVSETQIIVFENRQEFDEYIFNLFGTPSLEDVI